VEFTTADLCDAFPQSVRLVEPLFREYGLIEQFAGPIETVKVFEDNTLLRQVLEEHGRGRVLVVDGGGSLPMCPGGRSAGRPRATQWMVRPAHPRLRP
jgi:regulator of ribonuclease activity A